MKNLKPESLSISIPFATISFKIENDQEKNIINEILIRSEDKRFLTSWQCCGNCTENAIKSVLEYRKLLLNQKIQLSVIKDSQFATVVDYILEEVKDFLSISEKHSVYMHQKFLAEQLEILRKNVLEALHKFCNDTNTEYPNNLFNMLRSKNS